MKKLWKSYRHRFVPWLLLNWKKRHVRRSNAGVDLSEQEDDILAQLSAVLKTLHNSIPHTNPIETQRLLGGARNAGQLHELAAWARESVAVSNHLLLRLGPSSVPNGGTGVFMDGKRVTAKGSVVALYPGTVYTPSEPILIQSLHNPFVFRCADSLFIDGKRTGISKWIYRSCAYRDVIGASMSCDVSWLHAPCVLNPLAVGQIVNNHTKELEANVEYLEVDIPSSFPLSWRRFIPNVYYGAHCAGQMPIRTVALVAVRDIHPGEELLSSYLTLIT